MTSFTVHCADHIAMGYVSFHLSLPTCEFHLHSISSNSLFDVYFRGEAVMEEGVVVDVPALDVGEEGGEFTVVATMAEVAATARAADTVVAAATGKEAAEDTAVLQAGGVTAVMREGGVTAVMREEGEATGLVEWVEGTRAAVGTMAMEGLEETRTGRREATSEIKICFESAERTGV